MKTDTHVQLHFHSSNYSSMDTETVLNDSVAVPSEFRRKRKGRGQSLVLLIKFPDTQMSDDTWDVRSSGL